MRRFLVAATIAWTCTIPVTSIADDLPVGRQPVTREQVVADLEFFRDQWLPRDHSFTEETRRRSIEFVNGEISRANAMQKVDLAMVLARAAAFAGNNHSHPSFFFEEGSYHVVPISFWWFPEGAIVTRAHPDQRDLLGARIVSIGGVAIEQARERVRPYISGTADTELYLSPNWLRRLEVLRHVGLSDGETAKFVLVLRDGKRVTRTLSSPPQPKESDRYPDPAQYSAAWRASMVPGRGPEPWPHVLEALPKLPLYAQPPSGLTATNIEEGRVLYVRSNAIYPIGEEKPLESLGYTIIDDAVKGGTPPRDAIVDLRYNEGGNFMSIIDFVKALVRMTAPAGRIYVITGRATNSAAICMAAMLKGQAPDRTLFVGEHPSDNPRFYSEGDTLKSPAGIGLRYADGLHDWGQGCTEFGRCYWPVVVHGVAIKTLAPDIPVAMTFAEFAAGQDPALAAALADLERRHEGAKTAVASAGK